MGGNIIVEIKCKTETDIRDLVYFLVGDDFSFSYDYKTGMVKVEVRDYNDLFGRLRSYKLGKGFVVRYSDKDYNEWGDEVKQT